MGFIVDKGLIPGNSDRFKRQVEFLLEIDRLKHTLRQTILLDRSRHENSVEHSWHIALSAVIFSEYAATQASDMERVMRNVKEDITSGANLAEALAKHPRYFSDLYVNMVRAGEASGNLDTVLTRIADYLQKQASLRGKVSAALTYPCVMVVVGTAVVVLPGVVGPTVESPADTQPVGLPDIASPARTMLT